MRKVITIFFITIIVLMAGSILLPAYLEDDCERRFDPFGSEWDDISIFRNELRQDVRTIMSSPLSLDDIEDPERAVLVVVGMDREYSQPEVDLIRDFVGSGGKLIVANDNTLANGLSRHFGISYYNSRVLDREFLNTTERNVSVFTAIVELDGNEFTVRFNSPTGLEVEEGDVLCMSSQNSSLDLNGNQLRDLSDKTGPIPLIASSQTNENGGIAIFISSPSIFTDQEIGRGDNLNFTMAIIDRMLPGDDDDVVIFDISRMSSSRQEKATSTLFSYLYFSTKYIPISIILGINMIIVGILWWMAHPKPKPYTHFDRLEEVDLRKEDPRLERSRSVLLLKLMETREVTENLSILSSTDLVKRIESGEWGGLPEKAKEKGIRELLAGEKIDDLRGLEEKILRW